MALVGWARHPLAGAVLATYAGVIFDWSRGSWMALCDRWLRWWRDGRWHLAALGTTGSWLTRSTGSRLDQPLSQGVTYHSGTVTSSKRYGVESPVKNISDSKGHRHRRRGPGGALGDTGSRASGPLAASPFCPGTCTARNVLNRSRKSLFAAASRSKCLPGPWSPLTMITVGLDRFCRNRTSWTVWSNTNCAWAR